MQNSCKQGRQKEVTRNWSFSDNAVDCFQYQADTCSHSMYPRETFSSV